MIVLLNLQKDTGLDCLMRAWTLSSMFAHFRFLMNFWTQRPGQIMSLSRAPSPPPTSSCYPASRRAKPRRYPPNRRAKQRRTHLCRVLYQVTMWNLSEANLTPTSIAQKYSGSMKITTYLDHASHCKTTSSTNWSNRWTCRVLIRRRQRFEARAPRLASWRRRWIPEH